MMSGIVLNLFIMLTLQKEYDLKRLPEEQLNKLAEEIRAQKDLREDLVIQIKHRKLLSEELSDISNIQTFFAVTLPQPSLQIQRLQSPLVLLEPSMPAKISKNKNSFLKTGKIKFSRSVADNHHESERNLKQEEIRRTLKEFDRVCTCKGELLTLKDKLTLFFIKFEQILYAHEKARLRFLMGNCHFILGNNSEAKLCYQDGISCCSQSKLLGLLNNNLAVLFCKLNQLQQSLKHFKSALNHYYASDQGVSMGGTYHCIGLIYYKVSMYDSAVMFFTQSVQSKAQEGCGKVSIFKTSILKADCLFLQNKFDQAIRAYKGAIRLISKQNQDYQQQLEYIHFKIAESFQRKGSWELAINEYNNMIERTKQRRPILRKIASAYLAKRELQSARNYMKILRVQTEKAGDPTQIQQVNELIKLTL